MKRRLYKLLFIFLFGLTAVFMADFFARPPIERNIHMYSFRYGKDPHKLYVNRGDKLNLTISSLDTGHSFFLQEFNIDAKVSPGSSNILIFQALDPAQPPVRSDKVRLDINFKGLKKYLISKIHYRCHVYCGPLHAFEHGSMIIQPNALLFFGFGILLAIIILNLFKRREADLTPGLSTSSAFMGIDIFKNIPILKKIFKSRIFQISLYLFIILILYLVILSTLFGTKMPGRNIGIMFTWTLWLFLLTVIFTPLGGRIWCYVCPIPIFGEYFQRASLFNVKKGNTVGNNFFRGLNLKWPSFLNTDFIRVIIMLGLGTFTTLLVTNPRFTGWAVLLILLIAFIFSIIFRLRSFCMYICPVNAYLSTFSKAGLLALRSADKNVCDKCSAQYCLNGSNEGWACPYDLCVKDINENENCGLCMECLRSCKFNNVTLTLRGFAAEKKLKTLGQAFQVLVMLALATSYSIIYLGTWPRFRDYINLVDKKDLSLFSQYAGILWLSALIILPALIFALSALSKKLSGKKDLKIIELFKAHTAALIPFGLTLWAGFIIPIFFINITFLLQSLSDPFGWGWNLFGTAHLPWKQFFPYLMPWLQVSIVSAGSYFSFRNALDVWSALLKKDRFSILKSAAPFLLFLIFYTAVFIVFYAN